jgi:hypothetical protein
MNIFLLSKKIELCVQYHNDKHSVSQLKESVQMLSTAVRLTGINAGYQIYNPNHPCVRWARETLSNWLWLRDFTVCLHEEYQHRYGAGKVHKSFIIMQDLPVPKLKRGPLTPFALALPDDCRNSNPVIAYRLYYRRYKRHIANWSNRPIPYWWY